MKELDTEKLDKYIINIMKIRNIKYYIVAVLLTIVIIGILSQSVEDTFNALVVILFISVFIVPALMSLYYNITHEDRVKYLRGYLNHLEKQSRIRKARQFEEAKLENSWRKINKNRKDG